MIDLPVSWAWVSLAALGAFHGLNPAMGWLFAVAKGFQERRSRAVLLSLGPITIGHALSIGLVAIAVGWLGIVVPGDALLIAIGIALIGFSVYKVATRFRHSRWVGMQAGARDLALWSFLMATAHGAGLMLAPALAGVQDESTPVVHAGHALDGHAGHVQAATDGGSALGSALAAVTVHSLAMLTVAGLIALVVYHRIGVEVLQRAWINLDFVWVGVLGVTGAITLTLGLWSLAGL